METTLNFLEEVKKRISTKFKLTTDSFPAYDYAVESLFLRNIDYAQIHKVYQETPEG
ncbi:MAG: hypothetical protein IPJ03_15410 [Ignavibacteriales bacterium]|nr:hypothetical protein [Ignavibacteriales bacterium]